MSLDLALDLPGQAGAALAALGDRAAVCDLYDEVGSPIYHDITLADDSEIREILALMRGLPTGPVLELAAGAGRMTLPLVASGLAVTALDLSPALLDILTERAGTSLVDSARRRLTTVVADMSDFRLEGRWTTIALGSTSITLLSDEGRQGLYRCAAEHLEPGGSFVVTVPLPVPHADRVADVRRLVCGASGRRYAMFDHHVAGEPYRTVTVLPDPAGLDSQDDAVPVAVSRPSLFDGKIVGDELAALGWTLTAQTPLGAGADLLGGLAQVWEVPS